MHKEIEAAELAVQRRRQLRNLFVAGPLARGYFGELMGLPQVSLQPERLAIQIADLLQSFEGQALDVAV